MPKVREFDPPIRGVTLTQSFLKVLGLMSTFRPRPTLGQPMAGMIKYFMKQPPVARSHDGAHPDSQSPRLARRQYTDSLLSSSRGGPCAAAPRIPSRPPGVGGPSEACQSGGCMAGSCPSPPTPSLLLSRVPGDSCMEANRAGGRKRTSRRRDLDHGGKDVMWKKNVCGGEVFVNVLYR